MSLFLIGMLLMLSLLLCVAGVTNDNIKLGVLGILLFVFTFSLYDYSFQVDKEPVKELGREVVIYQDDKPVVKTYESKVSVQKGGRVIMEIDDDSKHVFEDAYYKIEEWSE